MRRNQFVFVGSSGTVPMYRHRARSNNFFDQTAASYYSPGQGWWGYR